MEKFRITLASPPDRENLVAEILYDEKQVAEISQERDGLVIQFYSHPKQECWEFPLEEILATIEKAKERLLS